MGKLSLTDNIKINSAVLSETQKAMSGADLGLSRGLIKLNQLLDATKPISCIKGKDADGGSVDFVDVPDNQTQIKALDILLTLGDYYPSQKVSAEVNHNIGELPSVVQDMFNKIYSKGKHDKKRKPSKL